MGLYLIIKQGNSSVRVIVSIIFLLISSILLSAGMGMHENPFPGPTAQITGQVADAESGEPLAGVSILIREQSLGTATDIHGKFEFKSLKAGHYKLEFNYTGFEPKEEMVSLKEGEVKSITIVLSPANIQLDEVIVEQRLMRGKKRNLPGKALLSAPTVQMDAVADYAISEEIEMGYADDNQGFNTEEYDRIYENGFKEVLSNPLSTFSIDVDKASYANVRRFINYNQQPPKDAVRIEELVNYFHYDYMQPADEHPFAIHTEISDCPWNNKAKLMHIGLKGKDIDYEELSASNLVFLLDVSGSMKQPNKLPLVKLSLKKLVDQLHEQDRIALVVYAGAAGLVLPSTPASEKNTIKAAIDKLEAGGSTAGGAGIRLAYDVAVNNLIEDGNNRIILCTDGDFNVGASSDAEMVRLIEEKRKSGVFITLCGFGMGNYKDSKMEKIADKGNGAYYYIDQEKEAEKVFVTEMRATLFTIAKDVKIQLEFNPTKVKSYRLLGYENRIMNKEDFADDTKDAGELGAGHTVTAMYEIVLEEDSKKALGDQGEVLKEQKPLIGEKLKYQQTHIKQGAYNTDELATIKLRYKKPRGSKSILIEETISNKTTEPGATSDNFRFAAAVAEFGMLLRESEYKGSGTYEQVISLASGALGSDQHNYRSEFIDLVQQSSKVLASK